MKDFLFSLCTFQLPFIYVKHYAKCCWHFIYIYIYIYIHVHVCVCVFGQHSFVNTFLIEQNRYFLPTDFCIHPFKLQYWFYDNRWELVNKPSMINCFRSTFSLILGHHQKVCILQKWCNLHAYIYIYIYIYIYTHTQTDTQTTPGKNQGITRCRGCSLWLFSSK